MGSKMPPPLAVLPPVLLGLPPSPPLQLLPPLNRSLGLPPPSSSTTGISPLGAPSLQLTAVIRRKAKWLKCLTLSGKKEGACRIICIKGGKKLIEFCLLIQGLTCAVRRIISYSGCRGLVNLPRVLADLEL